MAGLYHSATSQVLLVGGRGPSFALSRSIRQGCPLAPFLFLFFAETMSVYLTAEEVGLRGLQMPIREEALLDAEFADDTCLYLQGQEANLMRAKCAIATFCRASGALINWHKTVGFLISGQPMPQWSLDPGFRRIPPSTVVRYLGCQVGLELALEQQIVPLLLSI